MAITDAGMEPDNELDALGLLCPLPVLKTAKRMRAMETGAVLKVLADDPAAIVDIPHFCAEKGYELLSMTEENGHQVHMIRKT